MGWVLGLATRDVALRRAVRRFSPHVRRAAPASAVKGRASKGRRRESARPDVVTGTELDVGRTGDQNQPMRESSEPGADGASSDVQRDLARARDDLMAPEPPPRWLFLLLLMLALIGALGGGYAIAKALHTPLPERVVEVRVGAPVLDSVRELARLETVSFHMERVVELKEEQRRAFGLVTAADAILLVAAADVSAGVDLQSLGPTDVSVDREARSVRLRLPAVSVFQVALDEEHTYVHSRTTDLLAKRNVGLEGQARRAALADLREAAEAAGILKRAETGARKTLESLLKSLGYTQIDIQFAPALKAPAAR